MPPNVCRHAQPAAERALKAALVIEGIDFPFTHDLNALRNLLPDSWPVRAEHADLAWLTGWAVQAGYPGEWPEPFAADAEARAVRDAVAAEFQRRGLHADGETK